MKRFILLITITSLALLIGCNSSEEKDAENEVNETTPFSISDEELMDENKTVVTVNDQEITGATYNRLYRMIKNQLYQFGEDIEDTEAVKEQTINEIITQELIIQDAKEQEIEVDQQEIDNRIQTLKDKYGDQFTNSLEVNGYDEASYREQLKDDQLTNKYMEKVFDIVVTDEEIESYYNELNEEELPALEEVENQIRQTLLIQKQQEKQEEINNKIKQLKEQANIEKGA